MAKTTAEKLWVEGGTEASRKIVLTVLRARFHNVPQEVENAIRQISDPIALESWVALAATSLSTEEFAEALMR